jgi:hypothetical protein
MNSKETPEIQVSSAQEIRKRADSKNIGKLLKLKSGIVIRVGQPDLIEMVRSGAIPADLVQVSLNIQKENAENKQIKSEDLPKFFDFLAKIVQLIVLEPKIVDKEPKENEILLSDLSYEDKMEIFTDWSNEGQSLGKFRK